MTWPSVPGPMAIGLALPAEELSTFHSESFQPVAGVRIRVARGKSGAGLVVLDPRDALLGGEADLWLRPPGEGLALLLTGLVRTLSAAPAGRLKGAAREDLPAALPPGENAEIEKQLGLPLTLAHKVGRGHADQAQGPSPAA